MICGVVLRNADDKVPKHCMYAAQGLAWLARPPIRRCYAAAVRLYCLRLRASSQMQICGLLGGVSHS